jgi:hypothetical protein
VPIGRSIYLFLCFLCAASSLAACTSHAPCREGSSCGSNGSDDDKLALINFYLAVLGYEASSTSLSNSQIKSGLASIQAERKRRLVDEPVDSVYQYLTYELPHDRRVFSAAGLHLWKCIRETKDKALFYLSETGITKCVGVRGEVRDLTEIQKHQQKDACEQRVPAALRALAPCVLVYQSPRIRNGELLDTYLRKVKEPVDVIIKSNDGVSGAATTIRGKAIYNGYDPLRNVSRLSIAKLNGSEVCNLAVKPMRRLQEGELQYEAACFEFEFSGTAPLIGYRDDGGIIRFNFLYVFDHKPTRSRMIIENFGAYLPIGGKNS